MQSDRRGPALLCLCATLFVIGVVAARYDRTTGFTSLLRFGDQPPERPRLAGIANLPVRVYPGLGYDGQFYAQLAVNPDPTDPEVQAALDNPRYRARRILLPAIVHLLTAASTPWVTLQVFALANVACWLGLGGLLWRRVAGHGWPGAAVWIACMLGLGALDSIRHSLTDLPAMLFVFIAVEAVARGRNAASVVAFGAGVLTRDTMMLAAVLPATGDLRSSRTWLRHSGRGLLIALPLVLWALWLAWQVPAGDALGTGHFSLPGWSLLKQAGMCLRQLGAGNFDSRYLFGLLAVISLGWQAVYVLRHAEAGADPWWRAGAPFALFVFIIGDAVWQGYWAVARTCLPLTFAFNLLLLRGGFRWWQLALGNLCLLHAVWRILPD